jgi:hypothetical protein
MIAQHMSCAQARGVTLSGPISCVYAPLYVLVRVYEQQQIFNLIIVSAVMLPGSAVGAAQQCRRKWLHKLL